MSKKGFFNLDIVNGDLNEFKKKKSNKNVEYSKPQCNLCGLNKGCLTPYMKPTGANKLGIGVIAEAPGKDEDERGKQLVGKAGKFFRACLSEFGIKLDRDCIKTNAVCCRPPKNRTPTDKEINYCYPNIRDFLQNNDIKLLLLMGDVALNSVIGRIWKKDLGGISKWRGFVIPDRNHNMWIAPLYHPSFVLRNEKNPVVEKVFMEDLEHALSYLDKDFPKLKDEMEAVELVYNPDDVCRILKSILERAKDKKLLLAFDYETTGVKPHADWHKLLCVSICYDIDKSYSFIFYNDDKEFLDLWEQVLTHPNIFKTAHNIKYENNWTYYRLGYRPRPFVWDTMLLSHIIDNRKGITSLKFQTYVHFGLAGYDNSISKFMETDGKHGANSVNKLESAPTRELLLYCGIDSLVQFRLALYQMLMCNHSILKEIENNQSKVFKDFI